MPLNVLISDSLSGGSGMSLGLRDSDLRGSLHEWLSAKHAMQADTALIHELKMPRPSARIDVALVNGSMIGYEIKSDVDSLTRLPKQVVAFSALFDRVSLVTTERHLRKAREAVPPWWGIMTPKMRKGQWKLVESRRQRKNPRPLDAALLHVLNRGELIKILNHHGLARGRGKLRKAELVQTILREVTSKNLRDSARAILRDRPESQVPMACAA